MRLWRTWQRDLCVFSKEKEANWIWRRTRNTGEDFQSQMHQSFCDWEKKSCKCKVNGVLRLYFKISLLKDVSHHPGIQLFIGQLVEGVVDGDELFRVNRMIRIPLPISSLLQPSLRPSDRQLSICARLLLKPLQQLHWKHGLVEEVEGRKLLDVSKLKRLMLERLLNSLSSFCCSNWCYDPLFGSCLLYRLLLFLWA